MSLLDEIRLNWHKRQLIRWGLVTYPRSSGLVFASLLALFAAVIRGESEQMRSFHVGFTHTIHSADKTSRHNDKILVYDSSKADE